MGGGLGGAGTRCRLYAQLIVIICVGIFGIFIVKGFIGGTSFEGNHPRIGVYPEQGIVLPASTRSKIKFYRIRTRFNGCGIVGYYLILGNASRCTRAKHRRFHHIGYNHRYVLGSCATGACSGSSQLHFVNIVFARILRVFIVGRIFEGNRSGRSVDIEKGIVIACGGSRSRQGISYSRSTCRRIDLRCNRTVLCNSSNSKCQQGRCLYHILYPNRDRLSGRLGTCADSCCRSNHDQVIVFGAIRFGFVYAPGVFKVKHRIGGRTFESKHTGAGIYLKQPIVVESSSRSRQRIGYGVRRARLSRIAHINFVLIYFHYRPRSKHGCLQHIGYPHPYNFCVGQCACTSTDSSTNFQGIKIVLVLISRQFMVG